MNRRNGLIIAAAVAALALSGLVAYHVATFDSRMETARRAGEDAADGRAEADGGWDAYVRKLVNGWCVRNGHPIAYPGEGVIYD